MKRRLYLFAAIFAAAVVLRLLFPQTPGTAAVECGIRLRQAAASLAVFLAGEIEEGLAVWQTGP